MEGDQTSRRTTDTAGAGMRHYEETQSSDYREFSSGQVSTIALQCVQVYESGVSYVWGVVCHLRVLMRWPQWRGVGALEAADLV